MPKKRENHCPECREIATDPHKTRELVAPFPDKKMRITVTMFGMFKSPSYGKNFQGVVGKSQTRSRRNRSLSAIQPPSLNFF